MCNIKLHRTILWRPPKKALKFYLFTTNREGKHESTLNAIEELTHEG